MNERLALEPEHSCRALLWDLFGVFLPFQSRENFEYLAESVGVDADRLWPVYRGKNRDLYDAGLLNAEGYWNAVSQSLGGGISIDWRQALRVELTTWKGCNHAVVEYARELSQRGVHMGLLSNLPPEFVSFVREENPWIDEVFFSLTFSCELGLVKPDPAIFRRALNKLGVEASQVLLVDDSPKNVEAARIMGMRVHHFGGNDPELGFGFAVQEKTRETLRCNDAKEGRSDEECEHQGGAALNALRVDIERWLGTMA